MDTLLIMPNQLFNVKYIPKNIDKIILWEHPQYFTKYKYNKLKLVLHRASMKNYQISLQQSGFKVIYIEFKKPPPIYNHIFETADNIKLQKNINVINNPNFLISSSLQEKYYQKTDKFFFNNFYMFFKKELNIIPDIKSTDDQNRKHIPTTSLNKIPNEFRIKYTSNEIKILQEAVSYIKKYFNDNPGPDTKTIIQDWNYPINIKHALSLWKYFIQYKINKGFADYQDYMYFSEENYKKSKQIYHSGISSSLNIGLLNPSELLPKLKKKNITAVETFIRQLFWREYQLYCYRYCKDLFKAGYYFKGTKKLTKQWYTGKTHIYPLDYCIKKAFNTGYLHHIERLMVIGNFMLLYGMHPKEGFKWFMEFSIDSYEWVMYQNVYDMVFYKTGGKTMRRPYISSSNYIIKMSNLTKKGSKNWSIVWDIMYHVFLKQNKNKIGYPYE